MSADTPSPMTILPVSECWDLLSGVALGRLITSVEDEPEVFPVNYAVQDRTVLFRTAEGTKLVSLAINHHVTFEADDHTDSEGWSVIVKGYAQVVHTDEDIAAAQQADLRSWTATEKQHFVRIRPLRISGRRFVFNSSATSA